MPEAPSLASALVTKGASFAAQVREKLRIDNFVNIMTGLGGSRDSTSYGRVLPVIPLTVHELDWLYHGSDLAAKIVEALPTDALSEGVYTGDPEIDTALVRWGALDKFQDAWTWGRLYGQGALVLGFSDRLGPPDHPLDWNTVREGDLAYLLPVDGQDLSVADRIMDRRSPAYGDPRTFHLQPSGIARDGATQSTVHSSRLIMFGGARTAERQRIRNHDRDLSVLQRPITVLRDVDQSWRSVMLLLQDMSQAVFKIEGLIQMISDGQKQVAMDRMELVDVARSVSRAVIIDAEKESFEHVGAQNVAAIDPLLVRTFTRLAAAADMPVTRLMGMSPAGLNATGESDTRSWYKTVQGGRTLITPQMTKLIRLIAMTEGLQAPKTIKWPSLWAMTETERGALDFQRAQTAEIRTRVGMTSADEETLMWIKGSDPADVIDMTARVDPMAEAMGQILPDVDSLWLDTDDGHRLQVTGVSGGNVYFLDLDAPNPSRQYKWRLASFIERCRPDAVAPPAVP